MIAPEASSEPSEIVSTPSLEPAYPICVAPSTQLAAENFQRADRADTIAQVKIDNIGNHAADCQSAVGSGGHIEVAHRPLRLGSAVGHRVDIARPIDRLGLRRQEKRARQQRRNHCVFHIQKMQK